ncbi:hypothetical protein P7C71_g2710, partial [Lecanoromycetidae sp. Uapishka_2]
MFGVLRPGTPERDRMPMSPNASPPPPRSLAPMPRSDFNSREELLAGCKDWAAGQGYAVVIARSRFNRLWLKCDRGGKYENRRNLTPDQRKRKRGDSRLLDCKFRMLATCKKDGIWTVETDVPDHNHGPSDDLSAHPTLRRMTDEQLQKVKEMCDAGKSPAETLEELKAIWTDIKVLTRDIYNARKKYKTEKELEEQAAGVRQAHPYQDPNELGFPGPDPHGRWAWVPDGEEVTNKKSKRRRRTAPASQQPPAVHSTLDPQLQNPDASHTPHQANQRLFDGFATDRSQTAHLPPPEARYGLYDSAPHTLQHPTTVNGSADGSAYHQDNNPPHYPAPQYPNPPPNTTPSRLRSQRTAAPTATMSAPTTATENGLQNVPQTGAKAPSGQVLMSRIDRMEKEQRDQKNILAQILGAVQGMHSSPGSGSEIQM